MALAVGACAGDQARTASFRDRPDSVAAGDLRGPFDGRVVDGTTGNAVAGALVYATWTFESGYGLAQPAGFREYVASTDANGRYTVPAVADAPSGARLTDFTLVVYKRGYVAYRSDRRFADLGPRRDFAQRHNHIELERWRNDYSHARHLRYVGGGPAIASLTAWQMSDAAAELFRGEPDEPRITTDLRPRRGRNLVAGQLLTEDDVKRATGYDGAFETGPLGDEPDTATYTSQHFRALGRPESFDLALRIWTLPTSEADARYEMLLDSLPGVDALDEIADRSLRAREADIFGVAFLDRRRGVVALLTCGLAQCSSASVAAALGKRIHERIETLWPNPPPLDEPDLDAPDDDLPGELP
jgi:hypothetical protein